MKVRNFVFGALAALMASVSCQNETEESGSTELALDGKQWLADAGGAKLLVDLGCSEEGMMMAAMHDGSSYVLEMAGTYVAATTDETSGSIIFTPIDLETEEFGAPMTLSYSGLTETSVNIASVDIFGIEDPVPFVKVADGFIEISVPGGSEGGYVTENSIKNGVYWVVNAELQKVMVPLAEGENDGYMNSEDMIGGASYAKNAFTFTYDADETRYTIRDSYGRYVYGSANSEGNFYNSFNVSDTLPESGAYWSIEYRGDGTYDIYNGESGFSISYLSGSGSWEIRMPGDDTIYPALIKADNPIAE